MDIDTICLQVVGAFTVSGIATTLSLPGKRLLAFLALHDGPAQRVFVAYSLWPDASEIRATTSLRTAVWSTRRANPLLIHSHGSELSIGRDIEVDFPILSSAAARMTSSADPAAFVALFSRELLPDWYDDWIHVSRDRWREVRVRALEVIAHELIRRREVGAAIDAAMTAVAIEPLRETSRSAIISAYLAEGNVGRAVGEHRAFAKLLRRELSIGPSPALERLIAPYLPQAAAS